MCIICNDLIDWKTCKLASAKCFYPRWIIIVVHSQEGEQQFLKALTLSPNSAEIHGNLGVLYHRWGKHSKAEKCYRKALNLDPHSENVQENLEKLKRTKRHSANGKPKRRWDIRKILYLLNSCLFCEISRFAFKILLFARPQHQLRFNAFFCSFG